MSNEVIFSNEDFYISYNSDPSNLARALDELILTVNDSSFDPANIGRAETALCKRDDSKMSGTKFFILYGDHRKAYKALAPDYAACYRYFLSHPDIWGHTTEHEEVEH